MNSVIHVRALTEADIPAVAGFPPQEWNFDFPALLRQHLSRPYFLPLVGEAEGEIVAVGHGILNGGTGWLGNIIVPERHRQRGYGASMTAALVEALRSRGCRRLLLIATPMGEPVYARLGFRRSGSYRFFPPFRFEPEAPNRNLRILEREDHADVFSLDGRITAEARSELLAPFLQEGYVYRPQGTGSLRGYYLPRFGAGLVIASDSEAGTALLGFKHRQAKATTVVPEENAEALSYFSGLGLSETATAPRMVLGDDSDWEPRCVWSRAAGYCG